MPPPIVFFLPSGFRLTADLEQLSFEPGHSSADVLRHPWSVFVARLYSLRLTLYALSLTAGTSCVAGKQWRTFVYPPSRGIEAGEAVKALIGHSAGRAELAP